MASSASDSTSLGAFHPREKRQRLLGPSSAVLVAVVPPDAVSRDQGSQPERNANDELVASETELVRARGETDEDPAATLSTKESGTKNKRENASLEEAFATSLWDAAVKTELERYGKDSAEDEGAYQPGPISKDQLLKAAKEFVKRCDEADDESIPFVLVSQNCKDFPSREFELDALQSSRIYKLWYALTQEKDLLIIKYASDIAHGDAVAELCRSIGNFGIQFGTRGRRVFHCGTDGKRVLLSGTMVAADAVLQRTYPAQGRPEQLRTSFIAELDCENRGPKPLLLQLSTYLLQPVADYVLGIKVYKRSGPPAPAGAKRPFAAIALLWRRGAAPPGGQASFEGAWSFGTCELSDRSRVAFCRQRGNLQQVQPTQIVHPTNHTIVSDTIRIPKAHLVQGVVDENGQQVPVQDDDQDLMIDLGEVRGFFDDNLPP